jgi:hypothetical protein
MCLVAIQTTPDHISATGGWLSLTDQVSSMIEGFNALAGSFASTQSHLAKDSEPAKYVVSSVVKPIARSVVTNSMIVKQARKNAMIAFPFVKVCFMATFRLPKNERIKTNYTLPRGFGFIHYGQH